MSNQRNSEDFPFVSLEKIEDFFFFVLVFKHYARTAIWKIWCYKTLRIDFLQKKKQIEKRNT